MLNYQAVWTTAGAHVGESRYEVGDEKHGA